MVDSTAGGLLFFLVIGAPGLVFVVYALAVKRWRFGKLAPYMVGYAFVLSALLSALLVWGGQLTPLIAAVVVAISTFGTWVVWRVWAGTLEAIEEPRKQRGTKQHPWRTGAPTKPITTRRCFLNC